MTERHVVTRDEIRKGDRVEFTWDEPAPVSGLTECVIIARTDRQWPEGASRAVRLQRTLPDVPREATLGWLEMKDPLPGWERRIPGVWLLPVGDDCVGPPEVLQYERTIDPDRVEGFTEGVLVPKGALDELRASFGRTEQQVHHCKDASALLVFLRVVDAAR